MIRYAKDIEDVLKRFDGILSKYGLTGRPRIILAGGAAVMLGYSGKRWSKDVDALLNKTIAPLAAPMNEAGGFHVTTDSIAYLHPDYQERLIREGEYKNIDVFILSPTDLAISKAARGLKKDLYDIYNSDVADLIDPVIFEESYKEAMDYWILSFPKKTELSRNLESAIELLKEKQLLSGMDFFKKAEEVVSGIAQAGLLGDSQELAAIKTAAEALPQNGAVPPATLYLLAYAGESISDSKEEVVIADTLRRHFFRISPNYDSVSDIEKKVKSGEADCSAVNRQELFKLFRTFAHELYKKLSSAQKVDIQKNYGRKR